MSNRIRLLSKEWTPEKIEKYIGHFESSWFAYAADEKLRINAASGGVCTAILSNMMISKEIDGVLACRIEINNAKPRPYFFIAHNPEELLSAQGSIYCAVNFVSNALPLIRSFNGNLGVMALPCDTSHLRKLMEKDDEIAGKVKLILTLFCIHNSRPELTDLIIDKINPHRGNIRKFRYKSGHWRGNMIIDLDNDTQIKKPSSFFTDYQNLYFFCDKKCLHCHDHTGYKSDISVGDIWTRSMKSNPIKNNAVIVRSLVGKTYFDKALNDNFITAHKEPIENLCEGQARGMPTHYNISARAKAGKYLGVEIKDNINEKVRWNEFLVALMILSNEKFSSSHLGVRILRFIPRFIIRGYLYLFKALESI